MAWGNSPTVGTWSSNEATNPSLTPGAPSGSSGILLLKVSTRDAPTTFNTPTGWIAIGGDETRRNKVFARVSDGGANDTPTVSVTGGSEACAVISRWTGGNETLSGLLQTENLYGYFASEVSPNGNIYCPAITPGINNCLVLRGGMTKNDDGTWTTPPSGDTLLTQVQVNLGVDMSAAWVYRIQTTAAAVSAGDITNGAASTDGASIAVVLTAASGATVKYLKALLASAAAGASNVAGTVFEAPAGADITGAKIGEFTGTTFLGTNSLDGGKAKLLINVSSFGGSSLTTANTPHVYLRTSSFDTGIFPATVIEV